MSYQPIGDAIDAWYKLTIMLVFVGVPLALWKVAEIVIWLWKHIDIRWVG